MSYISIKISEEKARREDQSGWEKVRTVFAHCVSAVFLFCSGPFDSGRKEEGGNRYDIFYPGNPESRKEVADLQVRIWSYRRRNEGIKEI